jgi:transposase-like protein
MLMKLVSSQRSDDLLATIKVRFAEFNKSSLPSQGRKYPSELQTLVKQALSEGAEPSMLCRLTGVSSTAISRWRTKTKSAKAPRSIKPTAPRRLEVVGDGANGKVRAAVVIRLPSGVTIELGAQATLSGDLLASLATLEASHATAR